MFAGTNVGLRENNEDNFTVCPDLSKGEWTMPHDHQQTIGLGSLGCMMVVADGMGGQNAGEVASAIAVATVQELFSPAHIPHTVVEKADTAKDFLRKVIVEADIRVKKYGKQHRQAEGLGSTIVMVWMMKDKAFVAWLGDSRAYSFVPGLGIGRISKDHSYVQRLVDEGKITDEQAMNDPNSNIITRSLGDTSQRARPDVEEIALHDGEVLLLCSDGLCGVCKDDQIGGIVEENQQDLQQCKETLTAAALNNGGSDNITIALLQVSLDSQSAPDEATNEPSDENKRSRLQSGVLIFFTAFILGGLTFAGYSIFHKPSPKKIEVPTDSIAEKKTDEPADTTAKTERASANDSEKAYDSLLIKKALRKQQEKIIQRDTTGHASAKSESHGTPGALTRSDGGKPSSATPQ